MSTSGTVTFSLNARQVITRALRRVNAIGLGETPSPEDSDVGMESLNEMLKGWALTGPYLWTKTEGSVSLVANQQSYDLTSLNPIRILSVRYRDANGRELPMEPMSREEYFNLPVKDSTGIPTRYYFDPQRGAPTLYIWPIKSSVTTETLQITHQRRIQDIASLDNDLDIPQEWLETVVYNLADRLLDEYGQSDAVAQRITARAGQLLTLAKDFEREDFVDFVPGER